MKVRYSTFLLRVGSSTDTSYDSDTDAADLIRRILQLDPNRRLSLDAILSHVFFTAPRSHSQPSFYSHDIKVASSHIGFDDFPPPIPEEGDRLDSPTEETSAFATTFPIVDSDRMTQSSLFVGIEHTTPHHDPSDSGTTKSSPAFLSVAAPFLRRNVSSGSSSSINSAGSPIPVHSRTPSRTKRRSVGSMMSERLFSLDEEPGTTIVDYHGLLAVPTPEPLATESDRKLLDSLTTLGFDTGQMVHSVMTNACDSSGAVWWMLKSKADDRNRAIREAERSAVSEGQGLGVNGIDAMMASSEVSLIDPRPDRPLVSVSPVPGTLQLDFSLGSNPFSLQAPSSPQLLDLSAVQPPPLSISSVFSNECLTPPLTATSRLPSPASTPTTIRILDDLHLTPTKSRSNSINLLSRATAAIGNSLALKKSNDAVREGGGRGTEEGGGGKSPGSGTTLPLARLFQRKLSDPNSIMTAGIDTFEGSSPTSTRSNPLPVSPPRRPLLAISPHTSPARESSSLSHSTNDSINTASSPASSFATSASSERSFGPKSKGSKRNLFTNFRMWFGDDRRRKRNSVPNMGVNDSTSRGTGVGGAGGGGGGRRNQNGPHSYASSPLKRPPLGSRRSSHGGVVPSRQSSRASVHLIPPATVIGATELSRRRSDGSRASMSDREAGLGLAPAPTTTTTSSRPLSVRSFSGNDFLPTTLRRPLRTAGSSSSIGSGRSCSGTHGGAYRRTPTTTTVRRIHVAGRHPSRSRSATSASSICMTRQSSSSSITGNNNARMVEELESRILTSMLMVGEDNPEESILEEDELEEDERVDDVELQRMIEERQKTLRRLSQTVVEELPKAISLSIGSTGRSTPSHHHHHHSVSATTTTVFTAHKTHHLFGAPSQYVSTPSAAVTAPSKSHPHHHARHHASSSRPVLRDVFAAKDSEGEWIDEDKERDYGGGLGQLGSSSSRSSFLAVALPTAAVTMTNARGGASHDSPVPAVAMGFGGRYAESIAIETTALESFSVGSGRRGSGTANGGGNNITTLRSAPVIEEEEEEEED